MKESEVRQRAFAMPLTSPAYPPGPYRFTNREFMIISYRTDPETLRALVPEPLEVDAPIVKYEFIRMPDSTGFGDYTETGQVIPVSFKGRKGGYTHCMFLQHRDLHRPARMPRSQARRAPASEATGRSRARRAAFLEVAGRHHSEDQRSAMDAGRGSAPVSAFGSHADMLAMNAPPAGILQSRD